MSIQRVSASADQRAGLAIREAATASGSAAAAAVATGQAAAERDENGTSDLLYSFVLNHIAQFSN